MVENRICHEFPIYLGRFVWEEIKLIFDMLFWAFMVFFLFHVGFIEQLNHKTHFC